MQQACMGGRMSSRLVGREGGSEGGEEGGEVQDNKAGGGLVETECLSI
jgi:hypothetical protein